MKKKIVVIEKATFYHEVEVEVKSEEEGERLCEMLKKDSYDSPEEVLYRLEDLGYTVLFLRDENGQGSEVEID